MTRIFFAAALTALLLPALSCADDTEVVRIGIPRSVFRDVPPALLSFAGAPFKDLMKAQTGLPGEVANEPDSMSVADKLDSGKLQLGVFLGHEFAWAQQKYPKLEAIVCAVPRPKEVQAFILVRHDCKATTLADLKGTKLAMATNSRDHSKLFFEKRRNDEMAGSTFCSTDKVTTVHDAIHKILDGESDVTVVDSAAWNYFQKLYPGASQNLKILSRSEVFPPTVIAYKKDALSDAKSKAIRDGLVTAHDNSRLVKLMNMIRIDRFDVVPAGYAEAVKACLKSYPVPLSDK